jgi:3-oxo-5-alpha-steroid 4-dehydrogenase 1
MHELQIHQYLVGALLVLSLPTAAVLLLLSAPYGRHSRGGWGPGVPSRLGWILMESPAPLLFAAVYLAGEHAQSAVPLAFLLMWQLHYLNRTFVFPFRMRSGGRRLPLVIVLLALVFNTLNAYVNARWISQFGDYPPAWFASAPFVLGVPLFLFGWFVNLRADAVLRGLRRPGETHYAIPQGGLFRRVSCPNYLGEMLAWWGWALATWSPAGLAFAVFTSANLVPRALAHHRWYRQRFAGYPAARRAVIPFLL